ncbi:hypothetical protein DFP74_2099 [Nocardiopsis sp. Huas11]|uniref:hypothetical protein n=1 Tax=Nocardiopsis sp. Huas11 TaxID=2183912 RepID=UPI000EAC2800|nr:hypothetical protein [Nocardiopsis sp. Huas11]RKS06467.1 hypothetical protein DFP74_2099 [Nocardiopsis sp. Huas11]
MGLVLFPGDDDLTSPDVSWSYSGFGMFREWLARAEGFVLAEMAGFGGERAWSGVTSTLAPLLDHPDDDGADLTPSQCAAMLPRLEEIVERGAHDGGDPVVRRRVDDTRQLIAALRVCVDKDVGLVFG